MAKKNKTYIGMVIDRSGSMNSIRDQTIDGINTFINEQRASGEDIVVSYAQFDDVYELVYDSVGLEFVPAITRETFVPRSMAALNDAIGKTINHVASYIAAQPDADRPNKVVMVIVTDGQENASRNFTSGAIRELVTDKQSNHDWQFVFLAANQNAVLTGRDYGIRAGSSMNYAANTVGVKHVFTAAANQVESYSRGLTSGVAFTPYERVCSAGDSLSAQDAALQQLADVTGQSLTDLKNAAGQGGATVVTSTNKT